MLGSGGRDAAHEDPLREEVDERARRDGRALEYLGTYDPIQSPPKIDLQKERIDHWLGQGAQLSPAVKSLLKRSRKQQAAAAVEA